LNNALVVKPASKLAVDKDLTEAEGWPWVKSLWTKEELIASEEDIAALVPRMGVTERSEAS
jgi:hypothetical protein